MMSVERIREMFNYDPQTGVFTWKVGRNAGKRAGYMQPDGKRETVQVDRKNVDAARAAWAYINGSFPAKKLDHINEDPLDNRISNLREIVKVDPTQELTAARLRELLTYEPETGKFYRNTRHGGTVSGRETGTLDPSTGYVRISVDNVRHHAHRLAWLYVFGSWPMQTVDHANMDKADNRLVNLREATHSQNACNKPAQANNMSSGVKGVTWSKRKGKWKAQIGFEGQYRSLGEFNSVDEASEAYQAAAIKLHGEFARF